MLLEFRSSFVCNNELYYVIKQRKRGVCKRLIEKIKYKLQNQQKIF